MFNPNVGKPPAFAGSLDPIRRYQVRRSGCLFRFPSLQFGHSALSKAQHSCWSVALLVPACILSSPHIALILVVRVVVTAGVGASLSNLPFLGERVSTVEKGFW